MPDATLSNGNNRSHYLNGVCDFNVIFPKLEVSGKLLPTQALFFFLTHFPSTKLSFTCEKSHATAVDIKCAAFFQQVILEKKKISILLNSASLLTYADDFIDPLLINPTLPVRGFHISNEVLSWPHLLQLFSF